MKKDLLAIQNDQKTVAKELTPWELSEQELQAKYDRRAEYEDLFEEYLED
jgi:hypothetical protein